MIETKLGYVVAADPVLKELSKERLPVKTAYQLMKLLRRVNEEAQLFEVQRVKLCQELGEVQGDQFVVTQANTEKFVTEMTTLVELSVNIDLHPLSLESLGTSTISAADLNALGPFVVEGFPV